MPLNRALTGPLVFALAFLLGACAPALDWREVQVAGTPLRLMLPCRAQAQQRTIALAGQLVQWRLQVCSAADHGFGVAWAELGDPALTGRALAELLAAAAANMASQADAAHPLRVPGATPHAGNQQAFLVGHRRDGRAVQMQVAVFTYGTAVFQVTALGPQVSAEVAGPLMDSLRFQP